MTDEDSAGCAALKLPVGSIAGAIDDARRRLLEIQSRLHAGRDTSDCQSLFREASAHATTAENLLECGSEFQLIVAIFHIDCCEALLTAMQQIHECALPADNCPLVPRNALNVRPRESRQHIYRWYPYPFKLRPGRQHDQAEMVRRAVHPGLMVTLVRQCMQFMLTARAVCGRPRQNYSTPKLWHVVMPFNGCQE